MTFDELLAQVVELLQRQGRVSYGALKRRFALDDDYLQDLKDELIDAQRVAIDEDGKVLVWVGASLVSGSTFQVSGSQSPAPSPQTLDVRHQTLDSARPEAERRQLTVMFCDLVGSTALSEQLDPEDWREVVRAYQAAGAAVISRYEGRVAQYLGDGLLVYFGYPTAHEDDAQRAVHTGLGIVGAMPALPLPRHVRLPQPLRVRIGIHTGPVVVGEMGGGDKRELLALGETPNIAARVQGEAEPNTVVISTATYRLVQGLFECQDLGPHTLKGISTPLMLYQVVSDSGAQSRFEVAVSGGLTPLVGREQEVGLLLERWERVKEGAGQVVLLSGEAGIGKSRLIQELKERVAREGYTRIEFHCSPYYQNTAWYPVIEHIQQLLQFRRDDSPKEKLRKLEVEAHGQWKSQAEAVPLQPDIVPLLAALLSLPHPDGYPPLTLTPQRQKQKTQEALVAWLLAEAEHKAVLVAWEDLHWADPSTLELHSLLIDQAPTARLLTLLTYRPEFNPSWGARSHIIQLTLSRLGRKQAEAMVTEVTGGKALPAEVLQQIVSKTDGVPLFVEELTKMVLESGLLREEDGRYVGAHGGAPIPPLAIPATLQDSLMARLARLGTVKEVAQLGATLGREFPYELIQAVSALDGVMLQRGLAQLVDAEFLFQRGLPPQARYLFKHALIQDAAYQSLLKSTRQQYHNKIAQVLEEQFPETRETQPELLAHHYTEAGLIAQAIPYWQQAGQRASQRSAHVEAINHLTKGLELLKTLPDTPERTQQELTLQLALGVPLTATKGEVAPEVERVYARARELCRQVGETPQLFPVLWGLWLFYLARAELQTEHELGEQLLRLAQNVQDPALLLQAHQALGMTLYCLGEFAPAREHLEQSIALYDPQQHRSHALLYGLDPGVHCLSYAAFTLWSLGYPDQALKRSHEALTLAQKLSLPYILAIALNFAAMVHQFRREGQAAQERAEAAITLSTEQGFPYWLAMGTILRGWALAEQRQGEEGIAQTRQGLAGYRATGAELAQPYFLALLAEALAMVDRSGERFYEAELYRLKGTLTLKQSGVRSPESEVTNSQPFARRVGIAHQNVSETETVGGAHPTREAEACFLKAIEIARRQSAKSLELRAVMSLSRLWQSQGKKEEAHRMLAEIYGWFTEGFDTKDLQEAKALLDALLL